MATNSHKFNRLGHRALFSKFPNLLLVHVISHNQHKTHAQKLSKGAHLQKWSVSNSESLPNPKHASFSQFGGASSYKIFENSITLQASSWFNHWSDYAEL